MGRPPDRAPAAEARFVRPPGAVMLTVRKLPSGRPSTGTRRRREHLIPQLDAFGGAGFVGLESGAAVRRGMITYLGTDVSAADILDRYQERHDLPRGRAQCLARINAYLRQLTELRIGNVVEITYAPDGTFTLRKLADHPPVKRAKLP